MPALDTAAGVLSTNDLKSIISFAGIFVSTLCGGAIAAWWFSKQQSLTKKELYNKIYFVQRDVNDKLDKNNETCGNTKERVGLLELANDHLSRRMDGMDTKLGAIQMDVTSVKEAQNKSDQKSAEQHISLVGEVRSLGDKMMINQLRSQQSAASE